MTLHLLLFSSDSGTASVLAKILGEFDVQVESCSEMLVSVEKVTRGSFDAIVVDWDDGQEATFLLKTARELKSTRECLAMALVSNAASAASAVQVGAHGILNKPIVPEQVRGTVRTIRELIAARQRSVDPPVPASTVPDGATGKAQANNPADSSIGEATVMQAPAELSDPKRRRLARQPRQLPSLPPLPKVQEPPKEEACTGTLFSSLSYGSESRQPRSPARRYRTAGRRIAAAAVLFLGAALAYVWAPGTTYVERFGTLTKRVLSREEPPQQSQEAGNATFAFPEVRGTSNSVAQKTAEQVSPVPAGEQSGDESAANIQVIPVMGPSDSHAPAPTVVQPSSSEAPAQPEEGQAETAAQSTLTTAEPAVASARQPASTPRPSTTVDQARAQLPQSLTLSNPINPIQVAATPPILSGALTPVVLPEESAKQLLVNEVQPRYPEEALRAGLQGKVMLQAWIAKDGSVRDVKLVRGAFVLARPAVEAVKQWHYKPYYMNGQAVEVQTVVTVNFRLPSSVPISGKPSIGAIASPAPGPSKP